MNLDPDAALAELTGEVAACMHAGGDADGPRDGSDDSSSAEGGEPAEAEAALFLINSKAMARISSSSSPSRTSSPLTIAPTGLMTSWQTREHKSAARSSGAIVKRLILWSMPVAAAADAAVRTGLADGIADSPNRRDTLGAVKMSGHAAAIGSIRRNSG